MCTSADMQKHPSSLALIAEIFFKRIPLFCKNIGERQRGLRLIWQILIGGLDSFLYYVFYTIHRKRVYHESVFRNLLWIQHFSDIMNMLRIMHFVAENGTPQYLLAETFELSHVCTSGPRHANIYLSLI